MPGVLTKTEQMIEQAFSKLWGDFYKVRCSRLPKLTEKDAKHILYGDKAGGGHVRDFPTDWSFVDILAAALAVAYDKTVEPKQSYEMKFVKEGSFNNLQVSVVLDKKKKRIITAYPTKRNGM